MQYLMPRSRKLAAYSSFAALLLVAVVTQRPLRAQGDAASTGAVYTMTNAASNQVVAFSRAANGALASIASFSTQGSGNASQDLGAEGAVVLSPGNHFLFVVNTKSDTISSFSVQAGGGLVFVNQISSGGTKPSSLTVHGKFLYTVNSANIAGFNIASNGALSSIPNSILGLSSSTSEPAEIDFSNNGSILVVTEKKTNKIDTFTVDSAGVPTGPLVQDSNGPEPFGFAVDNANHVIVSEGMISAVSSYSVATNGVLTVISGSVPDGAKATCWLVTTNNKTFPTQYAYVSNTGKASISAYSIAADGSLTLLSGATGTTNNPLDLALAANSRFLYVVGKATGTIKGYQVNSSGALASVGGATAPAGSLGLAAF